MFWSDALQTLVVASFLRRLQGLDLPEHEPSTHGLEVWAGQAEADLKVDSEAAGPWKNWEESMHVTAVKDVFTSLVRFA